MLTRTRPSTPETVIVPSATRPVIEASRGTVMSYATRHGRILGWHASVQEERPPHVVGFVVLLCLVVMLVAFRSILVTLVTGLLNLISVAAAYCILVLVFQNDWAEPVLGFQSNGAVVSWIPLILFVVLFGLSMDYHVFVLSRIREAVVRGEGVKDAVRSGIVRAAGSSPAPPSSWLRCSPSSRPSRRWR
ncbi:MMPL family transporter [Microbispora hainanensis]|uniref:MMPL family transporter n=1 Tax=Microbispora hainanensis TaxID=568844 RepID=A0ABZ1T0V8_9ACTN|nr:MULTISPECIES: MMPL family transporter [Microbispora]